MCNNRKKKRLSYEDKMEMKELGVEGFIEKKMNEGKKNEMRGWSGIVKFLEVEDFGTNEKVEEMRKVFDNNKGVCMVSYPIDKVEVVNLLPIKEEEDVRLVIEGLEALMGNIKGIMKRMSGKRESDERAIKYEFYREKLGKVENKWSEMLHFLHNAKKRMI